MLLVIDVGNSHIVLGIFKKNKLENQWRINTDKNKTSDEYKVLLSILLKEDGVDPGLIESTVISCVVPPIMPIINKGVEKLTGIKPLFIKDIRSLGMPLLVDNPEEVGDDRIVNSIAGYERYKEALIIIDFGTATTFDVISKKGEYLGGIILPGLKLSLDALTQKASKLPPIKIENPGKIIGKNTIHCMQSGILFGYVGMVDYLIDKISEELGFRPKVIATGGLVNVIATTSKYIEVIESDLTIFGLFLIHSKLKN